MNHARHEFSSTTKAALAKRVGYLCSFEGCTQLTVGPSREGAERATLIGVACHIHAASPGGKRYKEHQTEEERKHIDNGIWMCQVHAKLIDDDEVTYPAALLNQWKQAAEARAEFWVKDGKDPWSHMQLQLAPFLRLEDWVTSRWGASVSDHATIFPTLAEFESQSVYLSEAHAEPVLRFLRESRLALIQGGGCCGKSVFGVALAMAWQRQVCGTCLWLDLRDEGQEGQQLRSVLQGFAAWNRGPLLLVVDNAHLNEGLVQWLHDELKGRSLARPLFHALFLARPVSGYTPNRRNLLEQMASLSVALRATPLAFAGVANRLFALKPKEPPWQEQDYVPWVKSFGGDLIAFGLAVASVLAKGGRAMPQPRDAMNHVHQRYLREARKATSGERPFLRMCALASLDLDSAERGLGGGFDLLYPELARDGLATRLFRGGHAFWQFQHAGLGELVLTAAAQEQGVPLQSLRQGLLLEYLKNYPYHLSFVSVRLGRSEYAAASELQAFKDVLGPRIIEDALIQSPGSAHFLINFFALSLDWDELLKRRNLEVVARLAQTPPQNVVTFLKYVGKERGEALLTQLLKGGMCKCWRKHRQTMW